MEPLVRLKAVVAVLDRSNVDTDAIIPKQFLKSVEKSGFGPYLFDSWRYLDQGEPGMDCRQRPLNAEFGLNDKRYRGAQILLTQDNFGCGSSREHAPWALLDYGFRVLIGPSFADIFYNNCFKNGMLPIVLEKSIVAELFAATAARVGYQLQIDLPDQIIMTPDGNAIPFVLDAFKKRCLLEGLDDIALTLQHAAQIRQFEDARRASSPWLFKEEI